jgi:hypothetical protein
VGQVLEEMSLYSITVPAEATPDRVANLWRQGYASVIRLPLRADANEVVVEHLTGLTNSTAPVLLFLRRLERVIIRHEHAGEVTETILERKAAPPPPDLQAGPHCELVTLDRTHRFLVFTARSHPTPSQPRCGPLWTVTNSIRDGRSRRRRSKSRSRYHSTPPKPPPGGTSPTYSWLRLAEQQYGAGLLRRLLRIPARDRRGEQPGRKAVSASGQRAPTRCRPARSRGP